MKPVHNILIFGDSYSTYEGYVPEGYAVYYRNVECDNTDVRLVEETWWHKLCEKWDLHLVRNDSWSGSTIGNTGYSGDCSHTNSFLYRLEKLKAEGFFAENAIDTVFVFGGTNDNWSNAPLGDEKEPPYTQDDLFCVCPAIWTFLERLRETLPHANIISLINTELKPQIGQTIRSASEQFNASYIELHDIHKNCGHPTIQGMQDICEQIETFLFVHAPIENQIKVCLPDEKRKTAWSYVQFLRDKGLTFHRDRGVCWQDKRYYWVCQGERSLAYIAIAEPEEHWTVWSDDSPAYATAAISSELQEIGWKHIDTCGHCGSCDGGKTKVIFGKTCDAVCGCTFRFDDPTETELSFLQTMIELVLVP